MKQTLFTAAAALALAVSASAAQEWSITPTLADGHAYMTMTLQFDWSKLVPILDNHNTAEPILTAGHKEGSDFIASWGIGITADDSLCLWSGNNVANPTISNLASFVGNNGSLTAVAVTGNTLGIFENQSGSTIYMQSGGTLGSSVNHALFCSADANTLILNDTFAPAVMSVSVSGSILSMEEAGEKLESMGSVPEPTSATLSLLALAGLAARRRRK